MNFDTCVLIGRFQPFHLGHVAAIKHALKLAPRVILFLGSHNTSRSLRVPWTTKERMEIIEKSLTPAQWKKVECVGIRDRLYNEELWLHNVRQEVANRVGSTARVALVGHMKDSSSYYLKCFPAWELHDIGHIRGLNGTDFRKHYFGMGKVPYELFVTKAVEQWLKDFRKTKNFSVLREEYQTLLNTTSSVCHAPPSSSKARRAQEDQKFIFFWCNGYVFLERHNTSKYSLWSLPKITSSQQEISWKSTFGLTANEGIKNGGTTNLEATDLGQKLFTGWQNIGVEGQQPSLVHHVRFQTSPCPNLEPFFTGGQWVLWDDLISLYEDQWVADHLQICKSLL